MKILLLGKNGQVGWELQRSLAVLGEVIAVDIDSAPPWRPDFLDAGSISSLIDRAAPELIVNAAAHTAVDKAEAEPELVHAINATAVGVMARAAAARKAWLVHYSTDYVFDGSGSTPWTEDAPTGPLSVYGRSKVESERLIRDSGCRHLIFQHQLGLRRQGRQLRQDHAAPGAHARLRSRSSTTRSARRPVPSCSPTSRHMPFASPPRGPSSPARTTASRRARRAGMAMRAT